jgi:DNA-binding transcriptional LysR family regulator
MDIRQIELFVAAAEEQHFTRAARRANIVQSGLSVAIRALEEELGTLLFVRSTRRVELSEAGRIFLPEARRILLATKTARDAVAAVKGGLTGRISIGTVQSLSPFLDLPLLLQEFHARHPRVEISVRENYIEALAEAVRQGSLDLAFMPLSGTPRAGLAVDPLFSSPMVAALASSHPLAGHPTLAVAELAEEVFIDFSTRWGTRHLVDQIFASEGVARRTGFEVENFELLRDFVRRGFGVAVLPEATIDGPGLRAVEIRPVRANALPRWELGLFRPKGDGALSPNPPADFFRALIKEFPPTTSRADDTTA